MRAYVIMKNDFPEHTIVSNSIAPAKTKMAKLKKEYEESFKDILGGEGYMNKSHWHIKGVNVDIV